MLQLSVEKSVMRLQRWSHPTMDPPGGATVDTPFFVTVDPPDSRPTFFATIDPPFIYFFNF